MIEEEENIPINGTVVRKASKKKASEVSDDSYSIVEQERMKSVIRHISHVQQSCSLLGERLILQGEVGMGRKLIANGFIHDNSKFYGIEWKHLHDDVKVESPELFASALQQHVLTNRHHPEYWDGIENMPRLFLAEMICDWHARSSEFGTDLRGFIKEVATKKFKFTLQGKVYKDLKYFVDSLLDQPFQKSTKK